MTHPARTIDFRTLRENLAEACRLGLVNRQENDGLALYCYSRATVYDRLWTPISLMSRGLILDENAARVVATPFPKFFNVGEHDEPIPALPFETFEKLDGSLIIIFWHKGEWRAATKGSLKSDQSVWAKALLDTTDLSPLTIGTTYLAEAVYPENRIVIRYAESGLVLLAAYDEGGAEYSYDDLLPIAGRLGWRVASRKSYPSVAALLAEVKALPATEEGFVIRFTNGLRLKVKGDEYRRIHAMMSRVTPLALWDAMQAGDDIAAIHKDLPEEFWADFDSITRILQNHVDDLLLTVADAASAVAHLSDKEVGLRLEQFPERVRRLIFPWRKNAGHLLADERSRRAVFRYVRPTRNELEGYAPSSAVVRLNDEEI